MKKILIATTNTGKLKEYNEIFKKLDLEIETVSLQDVHIDASMEETGRTLEENAIQKAEFYYKLSGLPVLSDDAGLEIDYLNGEPGVHSHRWLGHIMNDEEIIQTVLEKMKGVPSEKRGAQLRAVMGLIIPPDSEVHTFEGILRGKIAEKRFGEMIPGYSLRTIFIPEESSKYLSELNVVAHREQAVEKALPILRKFLTV